MAGRAATVTALSPAGFWRSDSEMIYGRLVFGLMQWFGARALRLAPVLSQSTAGRSLLYATIVSKPSRMTPEQAVGDMEAFVAAREALELILADMTRFTARVPAGIPVTIGWGTSDRLLPFRQSRAAKARVPQARLVRPPGCGHVPMTDDPALVADVLLRGSEVSSPCSGRALAALITPVNGDLSGPVRMTFQPASRERAQRNEGQVLARRAVDRRSYQPAAVAATLQLTRHAGVDQHQPPPVQPVQQFG